MEREIDECERCGALPHGRSVECDGSPESERDAAVRAYGPHPSTVDGMLWREAYINGWLARAKIGGAT